MLIRNIGVSAFPSEFLPIMRALAQAWPTIQLGEQALAAVLESLTAQADPEMSVRVAWARLCLNQARKEHRKGAYPDYELGWKNGMQFLRLTAASERNVTLIGKGSEKCWIHFSVYFGRNGSQIQAAKFLRALAPLEPQLKSVSVVALEGPIESADSVIAAALAAVSQRLMGHVTLFDPARERGVIKVTKPDGRTDYFFLHISNVNDTKLMHLLKASAETPGSLQTDPIPVKFNDGGKIRDARANKTMRNNRALDVECAE